MPRVQGVGPVGLLLWSGSLFGASFPLGKVAAEAGVSPMLWALLVSISVCASLLPVLSTRRILFLPRGKTLVYVMVSGVVTFGGINLMIFGLVPKLGAGQVGMMFALSPVATLALTTVFGLKTPSRLGVWGIGFGLVGALMVAFGRGGVEGSVVWSMVGLSIPLILAAGNVYRTLAWPEGVHPMALAFWCHGFAIVTIVSAVFVSGATVDVTTLAQVPWAVVVQVVTAALIFPAYFKLQREGGPVLLSQTGYVAAAVGLVVGVAFLGERYGPISWLGALVTAVGIGLTVWAQSGRSLSIPNRLPLGRKTRAQIWAGDCNGGARAPQQAVLLAARRQAVLKLLRQA